VGELMSGYGPVDILWLDGGQVRPPSQDIDMPKLAAMARAHQPGLIVVDRTVGGRYENYLTPEQQVPDKPLPYIWETCMTMGGQWSYKADDRYKSTRQLVHLLVNVVAKGGNFLLNVGPDPDGRLPEPALVRMKEIGEWMQINGSALYGTRPTPPYKIDNACLTKKGDTIYAIYLASEGQETPPAEIALPAVREVRTVRMLGTDASLTWGVGDNGLVLRVPEAVRASPPCKHAWSFELAGAKIIAD
jgi:alpha-L-fucosidase